ncbi:uroporphyrinogen decarboxylase [Lentzea waywayandensis]|uniref:Uroporphyrinogen decarboxylase n=1 Tax=Lentzea waywayandensis TaxID=84724 RepID=A0A1I6FFY2_9PSEU|nr:uroporphyrinogen decarboxylase [Lentzea waywayandensis]SFR28859.1 uroporphyrinogen decarboxylase [Lentzea waywayandensis]
MTSTAPLLVAAHGGTPSHTPVWFMRQAGRSLPEYRALRQGTAMLDACMDPEMVCEITMQPVRRHGVDGAILFSDIVVPLKAAGVDLDIVAGTGPVVANPVRTLEDVKALPELHAEQVQPVADAIGLLLKELPQDVALIGFAGAPFTLASYLVEGGPSKNHERTKALMHGNPELWHALLAKIADVTTAFLHAQLDAGVQAVQLFDSWAGALSERDYREFVLPHSKRVLETITTVPRIHFGVGTGELLPAMREAGADVVGVDWRIPLDVAVQRLQQANPELPKPVVQGNLDPALFFAGFEAVEGEVRRIHAEGKAAAGHIFNLGHGVLPDTDPEIITRTVELIHSL